MTPPHYNREEKDEIMKNGDIYARLGCLEAAQLNIKFIEDNFEKRLRDNEEAIRALNKDIVVIRDSQIATHKRISQTTSDLKENMKTGFDNIEKNVDNLKSVLNKFIEESGKKIDNIHSWKDKINGAIKLLIGIPVLSAIALALAKLFHLGSQVACNIKTQ